MPQKPKNPKKQQGPKPKPKPVAAPIPPKLKQIHKSLKLHGGTFQQELPEQKMTLNHLSPDAKVLEIGANIGRNTLIIASILKDETQFVTLECNPKIFKKLEHNRTINNRKFHTENSALSKNQLFNKGWQTFHVNNKPKDAVEINTITWQQLVDKYNIQFDTLIADCEGALYYILLDFPEMLDNINMIIMENDYHNINHKRAVDNTLMSKGFKCIASKRGPYYVGPCREFFYETWKRTI